MFKPFVVAGSALGAGLALAVSLASAQAPSASEPSGTTGQGSGRPGTSSVGAAGFVGRQAQDQQLATKLIDTNVYGTDGRSIGAVTDLLLDRTGNVVAIVIGVGEFFGLGEKNVAVPYKSIQVNRRSADEERLMLHATKSDLENAPAFVARDEDAAASTGGPGRSTGSGTTAPRQKVPR